MRLVEGLYDDAEEHRIEKDVLAFKNTIMVPLYTSVRAILTKLKSSELDHIYEDLQLTIHGLRETFGEDHSEFTKRKDEAEAIFLKLIRKVKSDLDRPKTKLHRLRDKLILIVNLLLKWREYTRIMNMGYSATRKLMDEVRTKTAQSQSDGPTKDQLKNQVARRKIDYIDAVDEASFQAKIDQLKNADFDKPKGGSVDDFLGQYRELVAPFMSPEQIRQVDHDFVKLKESGGGIYGKLRDQPQVTSDEFFKNLIHNKSPVEQREGSEVDAAKENADDSLFNLLNMVYTNVS